MTAARILTTIVQLSLLGSVAFIGGAMFREFVALPWKARQLSKRQLWPARPRRATR